MYGIRRGNHEKNLKNGGPVVGPGTGTSDSIKAEVPEGSYIMPADSTARLGLNPEMMRKYKQNRTTKGNDAPRLGMKRGKVPVNLSNGEFELPPEQVHAVGVQALEQAKNATHTPTRGYGVNAEALRAYKEGPKKPEIFFADGGLVEDPEKQPRLEFGAKAQGDNPARAQQMQEQFNQPVTGPQGVVNIKQPQTALATSAAPAPAQSGPLDVPLGLGRAAIAAASVPLAAGKDAVRYGLARLAGGDPDTLEGGSAKYRDKATGQVDNGLSQAGEGVRSVQAAGRNVLGVQPLAKQATADQAIPPTAGAPPASASPGGTPEAPRLGVRGWRGTGIGADRQGGEIAMRQGADGTYEFTNEDATPGAVSGAAPGYGAVRGGQAAAPQGRYGMRREPVPVATEGRYGLRSQSAPDGSRVLASGTNVPGGDAELSRLGSAANVGNGRGTFSQGEAGDAQMAMERFDRANQIRRETNAERPRELGDAGGRVTVVADSSRAPSASELMHARQEHRQAETEALRAQAQQGIAVGNQRLTTEQLQQHKLQQDLAAGRFGMQERQRLADLQSQLADPSLSPEARAAAQQAYNVLSISPTDRLKAEQGHADRQQKLVSDLYKIYNETAPVGADNKTPMSFDEWAQPALQMMSGQVAPLPKGLTQASAIAKAKGAIEAGAPRDAVNQQLRKWGIDPV